jgi:hypothetical protein
MYSLLLTYNSVLYITVVNGFVVIKLANVALKWCGLGVSKLKPDNVNPLKIRHDRY